MSLLISHNLQISLTSNIILVSLTTNKSYHISTNFRRKCKMAQLLLGKNAYSMFLSCWQSWSSNIRELFLSLWFQEISFHSESYLPILDLNHQPLAHQSGALNHSPTQILDFIVSKVAFIKLFNNGLIWIYEPRTLLSYCTVLHSDYVHRSLFPSFMYYRGIISL